MSDLKRENALVAVAMSHDNCCSPELRHRAREALGYGPCESRQGCPFCSERPNRYAALGGEAA